MSRQTGEPICSSNVTPRSNAMDDVRITVILGTFNMRKILCLDTIPASKLVCMKVSRIPSSTRPIIVSQGVSGKRRAEIAKSDNANPDIILLKGNTCDITGLKLLAKPTTLFLCQLPLP